MEDFLELANQLSWHDAALGACFQLGLDNETIRCDFPTYNYSLIELINLILFLNNSKFEVEEIFQSRHPAPSEARRVWPAHPMPGTSTYRTNGSDRLPSPKHPLILQSPTIILRPEPPPSSARSSSARASRAPSSACSSRAPPRTTYSPQENFLGVEGICLRPWRPNRLRPRRICHGLLSPLIRHGLLNSLLRHGSPNSLIRLGFPNSLIPRQQAVSAPIRPTWISHGPDVGRIWANTACCLGSHVCSC